MNNNTENCNLPRMKKEIVEHYLTYDQLKYYSYYLMLDALADESCCSKLQPNRSMYDQYWSKFYCKKAMSTESDLTQIRFG